MNVPQDRLNALRAQAGKVLGQLNALKHQTPPSSRAWDTLRQADDEARRLALALEEVGADRPEGMTRPPDVPLPLLDTPANRCYLDALRLAWEAGVKVDEERYGPTIGTDGCAQVIEMVLRDVEQEVFGAVGGKVRE